MWMYAGFDGFFLCFYSKLDTVSEWGKWWVFRAPSLLLCYYVACCSGIWCIEIPFPVCIVSQYVSQVSRPICWVTTTTIIICAMWIQPSITNDRPFPHLGPYSNWQLLWQNSRVFLLRIDGLFPCRIWIFNPIDCWINFKEIFMEYLYPTFIYPGLLNVC